MALYMTDIASRLFTDCSSTINGVFVSYSHERNLPVTVTIKSGHTDLLSCVICPFTKGPFFFYYTRLTY